jgi:hypothetical protein
MSVIVNPDQLLKIIEKRSYKYARIYEGHASDADQKNQFDFLNCSSVQELLDEVKSFCEMYPGNFTAVLRKHHNGKDLASNVKFKTIGYQTAQPNNNAVQNTGLTPQTVEQLRAQWEQEQQQKNLFAQQQEIIDQQKAQLEEFQTNGGKMAYVALEILKGWKIGPGSPKAIMQGTNDQNTGEPKTYTAEQKKEIGAAIDRLLKIMTVDELVAVSKGLTPEKFQTLKNFIN